MARIRSVHPGLWTDEAFVSVCDAAKLLFMGLWCEADDNGFFEWKPLTIKMRLRPASAETAAEIEALMSELAVANMIQRFSVGGRPLGAIRNFARFQRPKKPKGIIPNDVPARLYVGLDKNGQRPKGENVRPSDNDIPELPLDIRGVSSELGAQMEEVVVDGGGEGTTTTTSREGDFAAAAIEAAGEALGEPSTCADLACLDEVNRWREGGCDIQADVLPTIRRRVRGKPPGSIKTWRFFSDAIFEARDKRHAARAPPPVIELSPHQNQARSAHERKTDITDAILRESHSAG